MNTIEIAAEDVPLPWSEENVAAFAQAVLRKLSVDNHELSILLCGDARMQEINRAYRGKNEPTDVLSFPQGNLSSQPEQTCLLGDIVLAVPYLRRQAQEYEVSFESEFKRMLVHGILHLCGIHHDTEEQREIMHKRQEELLLELEQEYRF